MHIPYIPVVRICEYFGIWTSRLISIGITRIRIFKKIFLKTLQTIRTQEGVGWSRRRSSWLKVLKVLEAHDKFTQELNIL